jgi:hypothetical protein
LEGREAEFGYAARQGELLGAQIEHAAEQHARESAHDRIAFGECERIAIDEPDDQCQRERGQHLNQYGKNILCPNEATVEQRQAGHHHKQDKQGRNTYPGQIGFIHFFTPEDR